MGPCDALKQFYNQWIGKRGLFETREGEATTWVVLGKNRSITTVRCEEIFSSRGATLNIRQITGSGDPGKLQNTLLATGQITIKPKTAEAIVPWFIFKTTVQLPTPGISIEEDTLDIG